jgi:hypothetical protein
LWWTLQNLFTTRCFLTEPSVHGHVANFKNWVDKENRKTCAFTFQNMCFQISDIAKHVLWHRIMYWEWEEDACPANCQKSLRCRSSSHGKRNWAILRQKN